MDNTENCENKAPAKAATPRARARKPRKPKRSKYAPHVHFTKYTPQAVGRLLEAIADGLNITQACIAAGVASRTFYDWKQLHPELLPRLEIAREQARRRALEALKIAGKDDWRAMEAFLKFSFNADYNRNSTINVSANANAGSIEVTDTERARLIEKRERALADKGASEPLQLIDVNESARAIALEAERNPGAPPKPTPEPLRLREHTPKSIVERAAWREAARRQANRDEVDEILDG